MSAEPRPDPGRALARSRRRRRCHHGEVLRAEGAAAAARRASSCGARGASSARWIGASGAMNSRSRWRQPPQGVHSSSLGAATTTSAIRPAAAGHQRADRRRLRALALRVGGVLDVGAGVAAAVGGAQGGADGEVRVGRVGVRHGVARERDQLGVRRRRLPSAASRASAYDPRWIASSADPERLAQPRDLLVLAREVRVGRGDRLELDEAPEALDVVEVDPHALPQQQAAAPCRPPRVTPRLASSAARSSPGVVDAREPVAELRARRPRRRARRRSACARPAPPRAASAGPCGTREVGVALAQHAAVARRRRRARARACGSGSGSTP